jgi:hypothetical protein
MLIENGTLTRESLAGQVAIVTGGGFIPVCAVHDTLRNCGRCKRQYDLFSKRLLGSVF